MAVRRVKSFVSRWDSCVYWTWQPNEDTRDSPKGVSFRLPGTHTRRSPYTLWQVLSVSSFSYPSPYVVIILSTLNKSWLVFIHFTNSFSYQQKQIKSNVNLSLLLLLLLFSYPSDSIFPVNTHDLPTPEGTNLLLPVSYHADDIIHWRLYTDRCPVGEGPQSIRLEVDLVFMLSSMETSVPLYLR